MTITDQDFLDRVQVEVGVARERFAGPNPNLAALTEEVGELAKALLDEPMDRVVSEAVQVASMAMRIATEGDRTLDEYRASTGAEKSP